MLDSGTWLETETVNDPTESNALIGVREPSFQSAVNLNVEVSGPCEIRE